MVMVGLHKPVVRSGTLLANETVIMLLSSHGYGLDCVIFLTRKYDGLTYRGRASPDLTCTRFRELEASSVRKPLVVSIV